MGEIGNFACFNAFEIHCLQNKHNARLIKKTILNSISNVVEQYASYLSLFLTFQNPNNSFEVTSSTIALSVSPPPFPHPAPVPSLFYPKPQVPIILFCKIQWHFTSTPFTSFTLQCFCKMLRSSIPCSIYSFMH